MPEQEKDQLHAVIEGRVQGVGFRYFTLEKANALGLTGWVRNRWNGTVEVVAQGPRENLEKLLKAVQRGPRAFTTEKVNFDWQTVTESLDRFRIRRTE